MKFTGSGMQVKRSSIAPKPADDLEYLLSSIFASQKENGGKKPGIFEVAYLLRRYRSEFRLVEISFILQRIIFPILIFAGRIFGKYKKFADAPPPLKRSVGMNVI
jgi:hypothetical protein